ncbi:MAG TPA: hypothetical protein VKZ18_24250 [Polyangia bacterium]|nr:hypothetical protein [Polyangia bacterium]
MLRASCWVAALAVSACAGNAPDAGSTSVGFVLPNGANLQTVAYLVLAPDSSVVLSGSEDVSDAQATLSLTLNLPPGRGDVLEITAFTSTGTSCGGSSRPFDVVPGQSTSVNLVLRCGGPAAVGADHCPQVSIQTPDPAAAPAPGGSLSVAATASDPDSGDVLSFAWSATAGTFADATAPTTDYVCTTAGNETLVLTVDDHHQPAPCQVTFLVPVTCLSGD